MKAGAALADGQCRDYGANGWVISALPIFEVRIRLPGGTCNFRLWLISEWTFHQEDGDRRLSIGAAGDQLGRREEF